jgi:hypothetical protein
MFQLCLTKLLSSGQSPEDGTRWAVFQTDTGSKVVFWGSPDRGSVNIEMLKQQDLPLGLEVEEDLADCIASPYMKKRYKCDLSISEETCIFVSDQNGL